MTMKLSIRSILIAAALFCGISLSSAKARAITDYEQNEYDDTSSARIYGEVGLGLAGGDKSAGPAFLLRGGRQFGNYDVSFGYLNLYGQKPSGLISSHASLPTINVELTRVIPVTGRDRERFAVGGGLGYTMPNLAGGVSERADNDVSFTIVGSFTKPLSRKYDVNISVRGFFFNTDTHLTTYGSHTETLNTGQSVEVLDTFHQDNTISFNSVIFMAALRWG